MLSPCVRVSFLLWVNIIPLCVCAQFFFYPSSVDGHLDCLHFLAILNNAAMHMDVRVCF